MRKKHKMVIGSALLLVALTTWIGLVTFRRLPDLLTIAQEPQKADAIVVLAGDSDGSRVERAVELFHQGYSSKLVISGGSIYRETTWASLIRQRALELGVPAEAILMQDRSATTWEDAYYSAALLQTIGAKKVLVVTSSWHSRRAISCFHKADSSIEWISTPNVAHSEGWWHDPNLTRAVISEVLKFCWPEKDPG
jgi:uncharacterized SAM-binding protein YcdF (DUF218 family)